MHITIDDKFDMFWACVKIIIMSLEDSKLFAMFIKDMAISVILDWNWSDL